MSVKGMQGCAWDRLTLEAFDLGREDLLLVERPPVADLADSLAAARTHTYRSAVHAGDATRHAAAALAALGLDCPAVAEDIAAVARSFLTQFDAAEADLRVQLTDRISCPKFHCDNVRVRLVTTYHGPTTEFVHVGTPDRVRTAPLFALLFLKGAKHPRHADTVHHRSPFMPPGS